MIQFRFSFLVLAAVLILFGQAVPLAVLLVSVTLHELAHVAAAVRFGGRVSGIRFTALGEAAVIRRLDYIRVGPRMLIYLAGPGANVLLACAAFIVTKIFPIYANRIWFEIIRQAGFYNITLCVFNLLPVFPLDGGRLLQLFMGNRTGVLRANRGILRLGRAVSLCLILLGLVQAVLYPYNISMTCMGVYLWRLNKRMPLTLTHEFFQSMLSKAAQLEAKGILPVRTLAVGAAYPLTRLVEHLGWDFFTCLMLDGPVGKVISETELMRYVVENGLSGTAGVLFSDTTCGFS